MQPTLLWLQNFANFWGADKKKSISQFKHDFLLNGTIVNGFQKQRQWEAFLRRIRQPALVLHVLHLVLHVLCSSRFIVPPLPTSYRLPVKERSDWLWSEVKVNEWSKIGPLFILKLIYIIDHVYTYNPIWVKMCSQLCYWFKSFQTFGDPTQKNQNHRCYMIFLKLY